MSSTHVFSRLRRNHLPVLRWRISLGGHPARPWYPLRALRLFQACPSASCSWTLALPSVLPPTMFIYLHTLLWQSQVLSWRCGRQPRPSKSTPVLPSVWLWTAGICWRLLLGTVICRAKRAPRELPSSCVYGVLSCVQGCAVVRQCMFACGTSSEKRWQVLAPVRVFVLEQAGSRHAAKPHTALAERSECPPAAGTWHRVNTQSISKRHRACLRGRPPLMNSTHWCQASGIVYLAVYGVLLIARFVRLDLQMARWIAEMCKNIKLLMTAQNEGF